MKTSPTLLFLLLSCALVPSCKRTGAPSSTTSYKVDTVTFIVSSTIPPAAGPVPKIHIDTNIKLSGLTGGSVKSSKPYSVGIDYTDTTFTFAAAEFTKVGISYDDGSIDPGTAALKLPLRILARPYDSINSVAGGAIVKTKLRVISGEIPGAISRDEPFTLRIEGHLIKDNGTKVPFAINREYDVVKDKATKAWGDVMQDK